MKYWRGYLIAAILAVCTWALTQFAAAHTQLIDMVYPYMTRLIQTSLAQWSSGTDICLWQVLVLLGIAAILASVILMIIQRWNPIQWFGWVLTAAAIVNLLNVGLYGLNNYTGSIADDVRIESSDYTVTALEEATAYFIEQANALADYVSRDKDKQVDVGEFSALSEQAAAGFKALTYEHCFPIFAGSTLPVKQLGWSGYYSLMGITGKTVGLTGEAAVNPKVPSVGLPFAICREMACRMSITKDSDANFAAFMTCGINQDPEFRYSAYLMAYRYCYNALTAVDSAGGEAALNRIKNMPSSLAAADLEVYNDFLGARANNISEDTVKLLVSWHIQNVVIPSQQEESDKVVLFDPLDESDERLSDMLTPPETTP